MTDPRNLESSRVPTKGFDRDQRQIDPKSTLIVSSSAPNMELNGKGPENNGYSIRSKVNRSQKRDRKGHRGQGMSSLIGRPQNTTHAKPSTDPMERINPDSTTHSSLQRDTRNAVAEMTCFLWFEKYSTLRLVENATHAPRPQRPLVSGAIPTTIFRDWLTYVLRRSGVSRNVALLALMFIYRLRKLNPRLRVEIPHILDDYPYKNTAWAEISGIPVQIINELEQDFLRDVGYKLLASEEEWKAWFVKAEKFLAYYDRASRVDQSRMSS
ncbi:hypothetical protein BDR22DRAFT_889229 [Usnea florida]